MLLVAALVLLWGVSSPTANAASGPWQKSQYVDARLISAVEGTGQLAQVPLGIELKIADHWKTYWRSPGDAGLPPTVDWTGSTNLKSAALAYPRPTRFTLFNHQTFGYKDQIVFPVRAEIVGAGGALDIVAKLDVLVCENICVPQTFDLVLQVPAGPATPGPEAQLINRFESLIPATGASGGLEITSARDTLTDGAPALEITAKRSGEAFSAPDILVEMEPSAAFAKPQVSLKDGGQSVVFTLPLSAPLPPGTRLADRPVTLTLIDGDHAIERKATIAAGAQPSLGSALVASTLMVGFAMLGGLILNLMPCVLPVLSLKLMSLVQHGDAPPTHVRMNFLATAAGIIFSLMMIAAALIALKSAGLAIGWGIQFQQPIFVAAIAVIVALFACNMWGWFEIILPPQLSNFAGSAGGDGSDIIGNFVIGAFATLLATPCSAPFVGTAVGFALAGGPAQILLIFASLGVGLALPYLAIAAFPGVARYIPRPGFWMVRLRQVLGLALAATAVWLISILPSQIGSTGTLAVASLIGAMVLTLGAHLALPRFPEATGRILAGVLALAAVGVPQVIKQAAGSARDVAGDTSSIPWVAFDRDQIKSLVSQGKTVFVDVTADWCVVCKSNKKLVINTAEVTGRLKSSAIAMKADWTSPDPKISAFLASFGRYGIPLNVVYGPAEPSGILLPELLSMEALLKALDKASGKQKSSALHLETPQHMGDPPAQAAAASRQQFSGMDPK